MRQLLLILILLLNMNLMFCQIGGKDIERTKKFDKELAQVIDSTLELTNGFVITYSHDSSFQCIHLTDSNRNTVLVDVSYLNRLRTVFIQDFNNHILYKSIGQGACNPSGFWLYNKTTKEKQYKGEFPIYFDGINEIIIYFSQNDEISTIDLKTEVVYSNKLKYFNYTCCENGCYKFSSLEGNLIILDYYENNKDLEPEKIIINWK